MGRWNNSKLALDMGALHHKIKDIGTSRVGSTSIEEVSAAFASAVHEFTSSWMTLLINGGTEVGLSLLVLFLFQSSSIKQVKLSWSMFAPSN